MSIKILLVDDHEIVRRGLRAIIDEHRNMEMVGEAENGRIAVALARKLRPNIVIMDVSMPDMNGFESARQIREISDNIKIIALSMYHNKRFITDMLKIGVSGYISKAMVHDDLIRAINAAIVGDVFLSPNITALLANDYISNAAADTAAADSNTPILTPRQREVLQLITEGKSTKEIALHLHLSVKTIESNRRQVMQKLNIHDIANLTKYAIKEGLTSLEF